MGRTAVAILNTEHLLHNLKVIKSHAPNSGVLAMVKANAYGHGLRSTALRLDSHVESFGVASIDEALALRKVGIKAHITLMEGVFDPSELESVAQEKFILVIHNMQQLNWLLETHEPESFKIWLKVDTGLGRLGFNYDELTWASEKLSKVLKQPFGIMSHMACADEREHAQNAVQLANFKAWLANFRGPKSLANSATIFNFPEHCYDLVRPGLALYGISPLKQKLASDLNLKPVMTLKTSLIAIRQAKKGSSIGYGATYTCARDIPVGIMAMGYGDGYPQKNPHNSPVLVNNIRCPLIGRVSMDMAAIDLSNCPHARIGDPVTLWGEKLDLEEVALCAERSSYDLLSSVQLRVKFQWIS